MVDLREVAAKKLAEQVMGEIETEWRKMYHNASIQKYPDIELDEEWEMFWGVLGDNVQFELEWIQGWIKDETGLDMELYTWGRSGATVAPAMICKRAYSRDLDPMDLIESYYLEDPMEEEFIQTEWVAAYQDLKNYLKAFQIINKAVKGFCEGIPEWWKETKEANGYTFGDDEEEETNTREHADIQQAANF